MSKKLRVALAALASTGLFFSLTGIVSARDYVNSSYGRIEDGYGPAIDVSIMWVLLVISLGALAYVIFDLVRTKPKTIDLLASLVMLVYGGMVLGWSLEAMTETTMDANIGAGLGLIFGLPTAAVTMSIGAHLGLKQWRLPDKG